MECRRHHPFVAVLGRIDFVVVVERIVVGGIVVGVVVVVVVVVYWTEDFFENDCWTRAKSCPCHRSCRAVGWVECVVGLGWGNPVTFVVGCCNFDLVDWHFG